MSELLIAEVLEKSDLLEKMEQQLPVLLDCCCIVGGLTLVVRDLNQARIRKPLCTGKLEDSVIYSRFKHVENAEAICLRRHLNADVLEFAGGLQVLRRSFDLLPVERLPCLL